MRYLIVALLAGCGPLMTAYRQENDRSCMARCVTSTAAAIRGEDKGEGQVLSPEEAKATFKLCRATCLIQTDDQR